MDAIENTNFFPRRTIESMTVVDDASTLALYDDAMLRLAATHATVNCMVDDTNPLGRMADELVVAVLDGWSRSLEEVSALLTAMVDAHRRELAAANRLEVDGLAQIGASLRTLVSDLRPDVRWRDVTAAPTVGALIEMAEQRPDLARVQECAVHLRAARAAPSDPDARVALLLAALALAG